MKKTCLMLAAVMLLMSCSSDNEAQVSNNQTETVTISFPQFTTYTEEMTRATTDVSTLVTHLDVWITDGTTTTDVHQSTEDAGFGTITVELERNKTYTLYAVGHRGSAAATLADGVISFPDDKVTHSMFYTTTFNPDVTSQLDCTMSRIVGMFRLETTDAVPDDVAKMRFEIPQTFTRWNVNGAGANKIDRTSEITVSSKHDDGTASFNLYIIGSDDETGYDITVKALDANGNVVTNGQRTFTDVPIRNNYKTVLSGAFFANDSFSATFSVEDWIDNTPINF